MTTVGTLYSSAARTTALDSIGGNSFDSTIPGLLQQAIVAVGNNGGGGGGGSTAWGAITGKPANVTTFGGLANAAGVLANNGSGALSYTPTSLGGNAAADSGKIPVFDSGGGITSTGFTSQVNDLLMNLQSTGVLLSDTSSSATLDMRVAYLEFVSAAGNAVTTLYPSATVGTRALYFPAAAGTLISTGDTGTITDTMLAGSITPSKVTGTAAILGANTFTALQQFTGTTHAGLRLNNLTTAERDAIASPQAGMAIWNTTAARLQLHNGSAWTAGMVRLDGDTMTGALTLPAGAAGAPALTFGDSTTGLYRSASGEIAASIAGTQAFKLSANGKFAFNYTNADGVLGTMTSVYGVTTIRTDGSSSFLVDKNLGALSGGNLLVLSDSGSLRFGISSDVIFARKAAATIQMGVDAAGVTNQMFTAASRITSDGVGANLTIAAGNGRGGAGGTLILSTFSTAGAATIGTLTSRMTIDTAGAVAFPNVTAVTTETVTSDRTWPVTINGVAYKICLKA